MTTPMNWGTDVPVSMPQPLDDDTPALVDMDGFCFTSKGIAHNLSQTDWERLAIPSFAPIKPVSDVVRYDSELDRPKGSS